MTVLLSGRYVLHRPIANGAQGTVWVAWDRRDRSWVAVKISRMMDEVARHRFVREGMPLDVPAIVVPHHTAYENSRAYAVFELVRGGTLLDLVDDLGPLPPPVVTELVVLLLQAIRSVHEAGIVHRDLQPANVMFQVPPQRGADLDLRIIDFGHSARRGGPRLSGQGEIMGTIGFQAPEVVDGHEATTAADVFGIARTAQFALTGDVPLDAGQPLTADVAVREPPASDLGDAPELAAFIDRATSARPEERIGVDEAISLLEPARRETVAVPNRIVLPNRPPRPPRVWRRWKVLLAVVASLAIVGWSASIGLVGWARQGYFLRVRSGVVEIWRGRAEAPMGVEPERAVRTPLAAVTLTREELRVLAGEPSYASRRSAQNEVDRLKALVAGRTMTTVAGNGRSWDLGQGDWVEGGPAENAPFFYPSDIAVEPSGAIIVADQYYLRRLVPGGRATTIAGAGPFDGEGSGDGGPALDARLQAGGVAVDRHGQVYFSDWSTNSVRVIDRSGTVRRIAGNGEEGDYDCSFGQGDGPRATDVPMTPSDLAVDTGGSVYLVDGVCVRRVDPDGSLTTVVGVGTAQGRTGLTPGQQAILGATDDIEVGPEGDLYISDGERVFVLGRDGSFTSLYSGLAVEPGSGDEVTTQGTRLDISGLAVDERGAVYLTHDGSNRARRRDPDGSIHIVAGQRGTGYGGDGGPATEADLDNPQGLALTPDGDLLIADANNYRIRRVGAP